MPDAQQVWDDMLDVVRGELNAPTFKTWFEHTEPAGIVEDTLVIRVHNDFARDWIESRYTGLLRSAIRTVAGAQFDVSFQVPSDPVSGDEATAAAPSGPADVPMPDLDAVEEKRVKEATEGDFNPKYTFDSFVMGSSNRFAHASALAVAEAPGRAYNPLYIYGGVGLGKTHLLQAIGHYVQRHYPHLKVKYVSTEQFTNDFINAIVDKTRITGFRQMYRTNDVLLLDDIQFLSGKEGTQEEFFHTFNTLQQAGKQIVLSSDRPPKDIATLEERLRSRFEQGLITDIQPPELETRIAILRKKVALDHVSVKDDVLHFIADRVSSNIRELEGALIRIVAFSRLTRHDVDLELAQSVLKDIFPERSTMPVSVVTIQQEVCKFFGISKTELVGNKRSHAIVYPRQIAMYLSRELTELSLPRIGAEFGGRDHSTVIHADAKIRKLLGEKREVYNQVQSLTSIIKQKS